MPMPRVNPWNSVKAKVSHNNTRCTTGNNIERENLRSGGAGKPVCEECKRLNREGK
jgi:transposase-like protein